MGHDIRQPLTATALTLGGIPIKSSPLTVVLACITVAAWVTVGVVLGSGAENRWTVATVGAASCLFVATVTCKAIEVIGLMLARHAAHMTVITAAHGREMREQVYNLNWIAMSSAAGKERAKVDSYHVYGPPSSTDTGPFRMANGAG